MTANDADRGGRARPSSLSRRSFLAGAGGIAAGALGARSAAEAATARPRRRGEAERLSGQLELVLRVNGAPRTVRVEPRTTLLDALRVHMDPPLTGTKLVCGRAACGACTVLVDGRPHNACSTLAVNARGRDVRTVEGLAGPDGALSPVQAAFEEKDALMCGFCTPGFLMSVTGCLERDPAADRGAVQRACAGNLCRCGTYPHVFEAALAAGRALRGEGGR